MGGGTYCIPTYSGTVEPPEIFNFHGAEVRVLMNDGEPWFVAKDISGILGYRDAANLARRLDEDEKDTQKTSTPSGKQEMTARLDEDEISKRQSTDSVGRRTEIIIINESGLYNAVLGSTKPNAREFRKWVTGEVLKKF